MFYLFTSCTRPIVLPVQCAHQIVVFTSIEEFIGIVIQIKQIDVIAQLRNRENIQSPLNVVITHGHWLEYRHFWCV